MDAQGKYVLHTSSHIVLAHVGTANTSHSLAARLTVNLNGVPSALLDLQEGDDIILLGDPATNIEATRHPESVPVIPEAVPVPEPVHAPAPVSEPEHPHAHHGHFHKKKK